MDCRNFLVIFEVSENELGEVVERFQSANTDKPDVRKSYCRLLDDLRIRRHVGDRRICRRGGDREFSNLSSRGDRLPELEDLTGQQGEDQGDRKCSQSSLRDWESEMAPFPAFKRRARIKSRSAAGKSNLKIPDKAHFDPRTFISSLKTRRRLYCLALFARNENSAKSNGLSVVSNS